MKSTSQQRIQLAKLTGYNAELKADLVFQITQDKKRVSTTDLTVSQAQQIINKLTTHWGKFDFSRKDHRKILSLIQQAGHTKFSPKHDKDVADIDWFSNFLKSVRAPVKKPLLEMAGSEVNKTIIALEGIVKSRYK